MNLQVIFIISGVMCLIAGGINIFAHFLEKKYKNNVIKNNEKN